MKSPTLGHVKTRLGREIGNLQALEAYETMAATTLNQLPDHALARLEVHFTGAMSPSGLAHWLSGNVPEFCWHALVPQSGGDLGQRLWHATDLAWQQSPTPTSVTLIGTDCPRLMPWHYHQAWQAVQSGEADVVFGPTYDGGYYLQCMKCPMPQLFVGIPWSAPDTLDTLLARCQELGLRVKLLETLEDIDELPAWNQWLADRA